MTGQCTGARPGSGCKQVHWATDGEGAVHFLRGAEEHFPGRVSAPVEDRPGAL